MSCGGASCALADATWTCAIHGVTETGAAAREVADWISADDPGLVLVSAPGGWGKTSLLRSVTGEHRARVHARVDLRGLDADAALAAILGAIGTTGLDTPVGEAIATLAPCLVLDGLDELAEGAAPTIALLTRQLRQAGMRLIVSAAIDGDAARLLPVLAPSRHIRLDDPARTGQTFASVRAYLSRHLPEQARGQAGDRAAFSAGGSFLLAHTWAHVPSALGRDLAATMDAFLKGMPDGGARQIRVLLTALSLGKGNGLPRPLWLGFAQALSGRSISEEDADEALRECPWLIQRTGDPADPCYSLTHQLYARCFADVGRHER